MAEDLQRILECPMCLELYDSTARWPKLLPCQHTFCRACLVQLDKQGSIACPQCRHQHQTPAGGAQQLPNNFTMLALLDVHTKSAPAATAASPATTAGKTAASEPAQEKVADDGIRRAIAELAQRLQQKAGELSSIDTKRKRVEEKFLAVKGQVDAAFESRARDLQARKEALIKRLAGLRQEELDMVDAQKASAYQYLQKFQRDFAAMRESILGQRPSQEQYNHLLTVCQRYIQQIEHYALTIEENLHEISFADPSRTQLTVSINSYGVLQVSSMDKTKNKSADASILATASPAGSVTPGMRKLSTPEISMACLNQSLPHTVSSPNVRLQDQQASPLPPSSRSASPLPPGRSQSQTELGASLTPEAQSPNTATTGAQMVRKDSSSAVFALSGNPTPSCVVGSGDRQPDSSSSSPATRQPATTRHNPFSASPVGSDGSGRQTGEGLSRRNPFSATETVATAPALPSLPNSLGTQRTPVAPSPIPSSSLPVSRSGARNASAATLSSPHSRHASHKTPPTMPKPSVAPRPNANYTRHASIDLSPSPLRAAGDPVTALMPIGEQASDGRPVMMRGTDPNVSSTSTALSSSDGPVPPLPPRRVKTTQAIRPRSMSSDSGLGAKDTWVKFDTIGSRARRFGKGKSREAEVIGSGWFGGSFFERPTGITVLPQNLLAVVDERNHCLTVVTEAGQLVKSLGGQGNGPGQFQFPKSVCLNGRRQLVVSDWWNHRVQIWDAGGQFVSQFGSHGSQPSQLNGPLGVACDAADNIFVCDTNNHCVKVFSPDGAYLRQIGKEGHGEGHFICPSHLVVSPGGELLITDSGKHCVQMFSNHGTFLYQFGEWGTGPGQLNCPSGIMIDPSGYLFVASSGNHRVEVYNPSGSFATTLGTHGADKGQFDEPIGVASMSNGQILVCDSGNKRVQILWP